MFAGRNTTIEHRTSTADKNCRHGDTCSPPTLNRHCRRKCLSQAPWILAQRYFKLYGAANGLGTARVGRYSDAWWCHTQSAVWLLARAPQRPTSGRIRPESKLNYIQVFSVSDGSVCSCSRCHLWCDTVGLRAGGSFSLGGMAKVTIVHFDKLTSPRHDVYCTRYIQMFKFLFAVLKMTPVRCHSREMPSAFSARSRGQQFTACGLTVRNARFHTARPSTVKPLFRSGPVSVSYTHLTLPTILLV